MDVSGSVYTGEHIETTALLSVHVFIALLSVRLFITLFVSPDLYLCFQMAGSVLKTFILGGCCVKVFSGFIPQLPVLCTPVS